jgi:NADH-quinone oxidoreductase subunit L
MVGQDVLVLLVPALPLLGAVLIGTLRKRLSAGLAGGLATTLLAGAFACSVALFLSEHTELGGRTLRLFDWIHVEGMMIPFAFRIDALSLTMMLLVTGVGTLIHLYSIGYMHADGRASTFFAQLNLFCFAMLLLVMGSNLLITFIGWEGVGLCSYLLIGFWYTNPITTTRRARPS